VLRPFSGRTAVVPNAPVNRRPSNPGLSKSRILLLSLLSAASALEAGTLNLKLQSRLNLRDFGFASGERSVTGLLSSKGTIYGIASGEAVRVFQLSSDLAAVKMLARIPGQATARFGRSDKGICLCTSREHGGEVFELTAAGELKQIATFSQGIVCCLRSGGVLYAVGAKDGNLITNRPEGDTSLPVGDKIPFEERKAIASDLFLLSNAVLLGGGGKLFSLADAKLTPLAVLPCVPGRESWQAVEAFAYNGLLYAGTTDGYLFTWEAAASRLVNRGKPFRQHAIQALTAYGAGVLGVGGEPEGMPRFFYFDPQRGFLLGGIPTMEGVGGLVATGNKIVVGELGRLGSVLIYELVGEL